MEHLGKITCSQLEEIWLSLQEIKGRPHLEIRSHGAVAPGKTSPIARSEPISLPLDQLPNLLRLLIQTQETCIRRGLLYVPSPDSGVTMERGETIGTPLAKRTTSARRDLRVSVQLPTECRLVDPEKFWPTTAVSGEIRDLGTGGAQIWLPQRLPRFKQVDVSLIIDGSGFQARAEIVSIDQESKKEPKTGFHRHGLRWVAMMPKSKEVLREAVASRSKKGG